MVVFTLNRLPICTAEMGAHQKCKTVNIQWLPETFPKSLRVALDSQTFLLAWPVCATIIRLVEATSADDQINNNEKTSRTKQHTTNSDTTIEQPCALVCLCAFAKAVCRTMVPSADRCVNRGGLCFVASCLCFWLRYLVESRVLLCSDLFAARKHTHVHTHTHCV